MKWNNNIKFAFIPKWCDCGHTVWLEKYYYIGDIDLGTNSFPRYSCEECYKKKYDKKR